MPMHKHLLHPRHTGRITPHEHTAYLPLALLLLIVGGFLTTVTTVAWTRPGPAAGSIGLVGTMPGTPPKDGAVIKTPVSGQTFTQTPIVVSGTCPTTTLVEIYKNDIFAGSIPCKTDDTFSIESDLLIGENKLVARVFDALNQAGPDSATVNVTYTPNIAKTSTITSLNVGDTQLVLNTDTVFRGTFPNKEMSIPIDILGGRAPYAVNIEWGDSTNKIVSRPDNASFQAVHNYAKAGTYQISIQATDSDGRVAFLTVASIVNGQADTASSGTGTSNTSGNETTGLLLALWPLYAGIATMTLSFWIGEWREKRILVKHGIITA